MVFEVYSQGRTAAATKAILGTAMLLAGTVVLAAAMSHHRFTHVLGQRVTPSGWGWSFQPPQRFKPETLGVRSRTDGARRYTGVGAGGVRVRLIALYIEDHGGDGAEGVARALHDEFCVRKGAGSTEDQTLPSYEPLGSAQGVQLWDEQCAFVIRTAEFRAGDICVIALDVSGDSIDRKALRIFEEVCQSVLFESG